MDAYEYSELIKTLDSKMSNIVALIKPDNVSAKLQEIEEMEKEESFWLDAANSSEIQRQKSKLSSLFTKYQAVRNALTDSKELFEISNSENDADTAEALFAEAPELERKIKKMEIEVMLSGENDGRNAIVSIHPGAGGTESNDWASMLYRMYIRWAERKGFKAEIMDYQEGEEAGIKDATVLISGENAYGYLKAENGIHRLVRISPYDSNARRHTSFSSVLVSPEIDDDIAIDIDEKDIRIDYYRASGAGGQHVNKTDSAVRITHVPTNTVVQCQNDRSQHKNKDKAFKMLKSRLYELEIEKREAELAGVEKSNIGWGSQIRSYVLAPYQQVKDTRSEQAYSNVFEILDGALDDVVEDVLVALRR